MREIIVGFLLENQQYIDTYTDYYGDTIEERYGVVRGERTFAEETNEISFYPYYTGDGRLQFTAADNSEYAVSEEFLLGTLTFTNSIWLVDSVGARFSFTITASSTVAGLTDQTFSGTLNLNTNSNALATPEERADWFYIEENPEYGSVRVLERNDGVNVGSIELWGTFGSLDLVDLRNPTGGAFLNDSITSDLSQPVPEPTTLLMFGAGLAGLAGFNIRRKR